MKRALNFKDVMIVPRTPTRLNSRREAVLDTRIGNINLAKPFIVPSMRSLVSFNMLADVDNYGGLAIQPRGMFCTGGLIAVNSSLTTALDIAKQIRNYKDNQILSIEIANGHMMELYNIIRQIKVKYGNALQVWAGTVATPEGVEQLADAGANAAIIGIGVGSSCTTTKKTGVGYPMLQTILDCANCSIPIISAGGCREYGDVVKAIAAGADAVMIGALLAGCSDAADQTKYFGMASKAEKGQTEHIEGITREVIPKLQSSVDIMKEIAEGLQSAMSYTDSFNLTEFRKNVEFVEIK